MRLRNKKTGQEGNFIINKDHFECVDLDCVPLYFSLSELLDEWEDYGQKEPLIKDEKIRKAIRAWADACNLSYVSYKLASNEFYDADTRGAFAIKFKLIPVEVYLEDGKTYTIDELCGEEENEND